MPTDTVDLLPVTQAELDAIAKSVADRCQGSRKPGQSPTRYAMIWQAARLGAVEAFARHRLNHPTGSADQGGVKEAIRRLVEKIDVQANCLEGYAENHGFSGKAPASVFHWQATHFRDIATEIRAALEGKQS